MTNLKLILASAICAITLPFDIVVAQNLREVFRRVNPSVAVVRAEQNQSPSALKPDGLTPQNLGSGFLISQDGKMLTAAHIIKSAERIEVSFLNSPPILARVVAIAPFADLALLQLDHLPPNAVIARLGDSDKMETGDQVFTIGTPYGANHSLSVGWISARRRPDNIYEDLNALEVFQTDAPIFEGNSGGPLFNLDGEVIGVVSHVLTKNGGSTGPGFAIVSNLARSLMIDKRKIWVGVETYLLDGPLAEAFNVPQNAGLLVQSVAKGSLAAKLGIREGTLRFLADDREIIIGGDIILELLGIPVPHQGGSVADFLNVLDRLKNGDTLKVKVLRAGKITELTTRISDQ